MGRLAGPDQAVGNAAVMLARSKLTPTGAHQDVLTAIDQKAILVGVTAAATIGPLPPSGLIPA